MDTSSRWSLRVLPPLRFFGTNFSCSSTVSYRNSIGSYRICPYREECTRTRKLRALNQPRLWWSKLCVFVNGRFWKKEKKERSQQHKHQDAKRKQKRDKKTNDALPSKYMYVVFWESRTIRKNRVHPMGIYARHRMQFAIPNGWKVTWKTVIIF